MLSRHLAYIRTSPCKLNFTDDYFQPNMIISSVADASVINLYSNVTLQYVCHGLKIEKKKIQRSICQNIKEATGMQLTLTL